MEDTSGYQAFILHRKPAGRDVGGVDGLPDPRPGPGRAEQSAQQMVDRGLPPVAPQG